MVRIVDNNHRMCEKHSEYKELCPYCQVTARIEEHAANAQKIKVMVPVYRKHVKVNNKYNSNGGKYEDKTSS